MFILCSHIDNINFDETLILSILSKFKITSFVDRDGIIDENIFLSLLQIPSIQETLEHFRINNLDISKCTSVVDLLVEFKRINIVRIGCYYYDDGLDEWKQKIEQFKEIMKKRHSEIDIKIDTKYRKKNE